MRAPEFWYEKPGVVAGLLTPIGAALDAAGRLKRAVTRPYRAPVPVICVGNLVAGGSGKTPVALSLATKLASRGIRAAIVMRGYGGRLAGPLRVDPQMHDAAAVGDEALLAAMRTTCWVARDRAAGVRAAIAEGAQTSILDDGFQNPGIAKDLALVVVDGVYGFGNGRLIPAGPLRERVAAGLARADTVVLIGEGTWPKAQQPVLRACLEPVAGGRFAGARLVAFAGIGRPEKFFASLRATGAILTAAHGFPDHYPYRESDLAALRREATDTDARLVTTRKDWVRLAPRDRDAMDVLDVDLRWNDPDALDRLLAPLLACIGDDGRTARV